MTKVLGPCRSVSAKHRHVNVHLLVASDSDSNKRRALPACVTGYG
jgi:hypothetical protein